MNRKPQTLTFQSQGKISARSSGSQARKTTMRSVQCPSSNLIAEKLFSDFVFSVQIRESSQKRPLTSSLSRPSNITASIMDSNKGRTHFAILVMSWDTSPVSPALRHRLHVTVMASPSCVRSTREPGELSSMALVSSPSTAVETLVILPTFVAFSIHGCVV